jgi:hypothetical protein
MFGKSSTEPNFKLHLLRLEMQALYKRRENLWFAVRDLTILGRQRDGDGQNKLLQINGSEDSSSYIINHTNLIQF